MPRNSSSNPGLQVAAAAVLRRARDQEYVVPRQIREELARAGLPESRWKEVLSTAGASLTCRHGRYYYVPVGSPRMRAHLRHGQRRQQAIHKVVRWMIGQQRKTNLVQRERRAHKRFDFVRSVRIQTEKLQEHQVLTREISASGIRLVAATDLQGQKVRVWVPFPEADRTVGFKVHVLWSAEVGEGLFENGGLFVELLKCV